MAGPWEQYASPETAAPAAPAAGPWTAYEPQTGAAPATPPGGSFDDRFSGEPIPEPFLRRAAIGRALERVATKTASSAVEGAGEGTPTGFTDETLNALIEHGVFHDPSTGRPGALQYFNEMLMLPAAKGWEALTRGISGAIHGTGGFVGALREELGGSETEGNQAKREITNLGNMLLVEAGMGRYSRPRLADGRPVPQEIGTLPTEADFAVAAKNAGLNEARLREHWKENGVHPAEAAADVIADDFLKHDLSKPMPPTPIEAIAKDHGIRIEYQHAIEFKDEIPGAPNAYRLRSPYAKDWSVHLPNMSDAEFLQSYGADKQTVIAHEVSHLLLKNWDVTGEIKGPAYKDLRDELRAVSQEFRPYVWENAKPYGNKSAELMADGLAVWMTNPEARAQMPLFKKMLGSRLDKFDGPPSAGESANRVGTTNIGFGSAAMKAWRESITTEAEAEGLAHSLSAAVNDLPEPTPITPQAPSPPAGRLAAAVTQTADTLLDLGKDIQMKLAPMATGTTESMAAAKDFANTMRRNRWEWSRVDEDIAKRFTPEQRTRMWNAADEESVLRQEGKTSEHMGLETLTPEERAAVDDLHARAQNAWVRAYDVGLVDSPGLPAYTPRMVINTANALAEDKALPLNSIGDNLKTSSGNLKQRKHMTAEETEAAAKAKYGEDAKIARDIRTLPLATAKLEDAIAGRSLINNIRDAGKATGEETVAEGAIPAGSDHKWFTLDHPAFRTWRPKFDKGQALKDAEGNPVFEQVPLYVRDDFEGPLRAVLSTKSGPLYNAAMEIKGKTMSLIMYSPAIHNMVEFGRAFPAMPTRIVKAYFDGNRAKNDLVVMREAIDNGLVPIGKRFFKQDLDAVMEAPDLTPGRSWTAKVLGAVPGLFDEAAGVAVKRAIDKAGDFWHNTLLWDRIADLQMGIYVNMRGDLVRKGVDPQTSSRIAAHLANRYAGALPQEAMSAAARKSANLLLFSRTFTMGNLGVMKDMLTGMPKDVLAQIERDMGTIDPNAVGYAKSLARRKALSTIVLDVGLMYIGNSVLQSAFNVMLGQNDLSEELHGYTKRMRDVMNEATAHPLSMLQPFDIAEKLSATSENEPGRKEKVLIGYQKDGTAIYARNPVGKIGEEFTGYLTSPLEMLKRKEGTMARPMLQILQNDKGFGRKIYDPNADAPAKYAGNIWAIVEHFAKAQGPEGQINAFADLVKGDGDPKTNLLQTLGPFAGVTFSKGAPGGPAVGELYKGKEIHDYQVQLQLSDIRKQIQRGDVEGAQAKMTELGIPGGLQRFYVRTSQNPATRLSPRALGDFYRYATPEQRTRMERARATPAGPLAPE